jgi:hypothetical protein
MDYTDTSIDSWTGEYSEEYCYSCQKFIEADMDGNCPICEETLDFGVDWAGSSDTAKTAISSAPSVSADGDIWGRTGSGYTWGGQTTWNQWGGGSMSGMWGSYGGSHIDQGNAQRMLKHKRHLDSLCKVVDPTITHNLSFANTRTAYTNMATGDIVIDGSLIKSSDDKLDTVAGLAIHEKLHLVHTKPLIRWEKEYAYEKQLDRWETELLHSIGNSVEDEYIEKQLAKDCAGFVQYISKTKSYYFNEKMKSILEKPEKNPYIDLMNTMLAFIRYPEQIDKNRKKRHAKHIQFFARALAKALDSRANTLKAIETLFVYMKKVAEKMVKDMPDTSKEDIAKRMEELRDKLGDTELSADDWKEIEKKVADDMKKSKGKHTVRGKLLAGDDWDKYKNVCGATEYNPPEEDSHKRMLSRKLIEEIEKLEETDYHETALGKSECISPRQTKVVWQNVLPDDREKDIYRYDSKAMKGQTNMLKKKIQLYGNRDVLTIRNQKRGRLDKRMLHRIPMDRLDLFKTSLVTEDKPLDVCLLVDESGSMGGSRIRDARRACISISEALSDNEKLDLWVMGHTADGWNWHGDNGATNMSIYKSPKIADRPMAMGGMKARCENRDGNAILAAGEKVGKESDSPMSKKLMIIFSDGSPAAVGYGGMKGIDHVKKCVKSLEAKGWAIIQVGFGGAHLQERMFDNHIYIHDTNDLSTKVSKIIRKVIKI